MKFRLVVNLTKYQGCVFITPLIFRGPLSLRRNRMEGPQAYPNPAFSWKASSMMCDWTLDMVGERGFYIFSTH